MKRRKQGRRGGDNGFAEWGGYMAAKKAKLEDQFTIDAAREPSTSSSGIFQGVAIFVNGYSVPSADELKLLMMKHGGVYHHYYRRDKTTHIIATNLPDTKVKQLKNMNIVKPDWIVDSISAGKLLDYRQYLLYSHQSKTQPRLVFKQTFELDSKPNTSTSVQSSSAQSSACCSDNEDSNLLDECPADSESSTGCLSLIDEAEVKCDGKNTTTPTKMTSNSIKTASEAGFLSEFYSNSRLHHISTMGATFKQYVNNLREMNTGVFPGAEKLKSWKESQSGRSFLSCSLEKYNNVIMHIDMDCFFVSVGLRKRPDLKGFPVAVTHAKAGTEIGNSRRAGVNRKAEFDLYKTRREEKFKVNDVSNVQNEDVKPWSDWVEAIDESSSMSEIASCNYEARKLGLKNGMFLGQALKLCPNLKTIPYDFEGYKEVSYCLYDTVASYTVDIEAVSCDEMFVDCTSLLNTTDTSPLQLAALLRAEITEKTGCPCSAGFGSNRLQARLATRQAKPDGQYYLEPSAVQHFMSNIKVTDLPGVGRSTSYKLASMGVTNCHDLQQIPLARLQAEFGVKTGDSLYKHCRGQDAKKLVFGQVRKSVSAEVNYGIRFHNVEESETFLQELSKEVHNRLKEVNMKTKVITLKLMIRAKDAPAESAKFLGHGVCDHVSRSSSLSAPTSDIQTITREVMCLSRQMSVQPSDLRGIGIQLTRLESTKTAKPSGNVIDKFLRPKTEITTVLKKEINSKQQEVTDNKSSKLVINNFFTAKKRIPNQNKPVSSSVKPIKAMEIDREVLAALPDDIRREVMSEYGLRTQEGEGCSTGSRPKEPNNTQAPDCDLSFSQIDYEVFDELPLEIKNEIRSSVSANRMKAAAKTSKENPDSVIANNHKEMREEEEGPKLDRSLPLSEVRALITAWTGSEECPQQCDINMLTDYLEGLVLSRRLDNLDICISCLHRCVEKRQSTPWQDAYHTIVSSVQSVMVDVYGLHLWVPKTFRTYESLMQCI